MLSRSTLKTNKKLVKIIELEEEEIKLDVMIEKLIDRQKISKMILKINRFRSKITSITETYIALPRVKEEAEIKIGMKNRTKTRTIVNNTIIMLRVIIVLRSKERVGTTQEMVNIQKSLTIRMRRKMSRSTLQLNRKRKKR
jgi:hypothetical protein